MSFRANPVNHQLSLIDKVANMTDREINGLMRSWPEIFASEIFPNIDEEPFSVMYSKKDSRPNTPVNIIVGLLFLKESFNMSDDEVVEALMYDLRFQYALHTTSYKEQPISDKTLSRFRKRCYEYEAQTGRDLLHECVNNLSAAIAKIMDITGQTRRMDSMMLDANIKKLSRVELIYSCVSRVAIFVHKHNAQLIPEELLHYTDKDDYNKTFYRRRSNETDEVLEQLFADADKLLDICKKNELAANVNYFLLERCLREQTVVEDDKRRLATKEDHQMTSDCLQNPTDPEATFRHKAGKDHSGYVGNVEESVGDNGSVVTDYQYEQNNVSDSQMLKDNLDSQEIQEERTVIIADGAYSGEDNTELAESKNIELVTTNLTGKSTPDIMADFEFNEDGTKVTNCPAGHEPQKCRYEKSSGQCVLTMEHDCCAGCPHKDECRAKIHKNVANVSVSLKAKKRAESQRKTQSEEYKNRCRLRNGVETVASSLRRNYNVDNLPRGRQRGKFFFGCKIAALNFGKLVTYRRGKGNYAQNPVIA